MLCTASVWGVNLPLSIYRRDHFGSSEVIRKMRNHNPCTWKRLKYINLLGIVTDFSGRIRVTVGKMCMEVPPGFIGAHGSVT